MNKLNPWEVANVLNAAAERLGYRLELLAVSCDEQGENGRITFISFHPHFKACRCEACKANVAVIKMRVASFGDYGENLASAHDQNPGAVN